MQQDISTRALITLECSGYAIPCTLHKACTGPAVTDMREEQRNTIGILFLNSLSPTRAAPGDSYVSWADSFARKGFPCFRIDLPGFGDSVTDPPENLVEFINSGGYAPVTCSVIDTLLENFQLSGVVVVGLCAGAVSAIYAAAAKQECCGLILLDPYFHIPETGGATILEKVEGHIPPGALRRWTMRVLDRPRSCRERQSSDEFPKDANLNLLYNLRSVISSDRPIMIINSPIKAAAEANFNYVAYIQRWMLKKNQVVTKVVSGAHHTFANREARDAVREITEQWLCSTFRTITTPA